jgi:hypothetical protein
MEAATHPVNGSLTIIDSATGGKITVETPRIRWRRVCRQWRQPYNDRRNRHENSASYYGGGVYVAIGGSFTMSGDSAISQTTSQIQHRRGAEYMYITAASP